MHSFTVSGQSKQTSKQASKHIHMDVHNAVMLVWGSPLHLQCKLHCTNNKDQSNIKHACLLVWDDGHPFYSCCNINCSNNKDQSNIKHACLLVCIPSTQVLPSVSGGYCPYIPGYHALSSVDLEILCCKIFMFYYFV